jgi:hypothetical protein
MGIFIVVDNAMKRENYESTWSLQVIITRKYESEQLKALEEVFD